MAKGFSARSSGRTGCFKLAAFCVGVALVFVAGCPRRQPSEQAAALGDPLEDVPVVLGNEALRLEQETRGIGTLFNQSIFLDRKREADRVKAERELEIEKLEEEIEERFSYIRAVENIKNNIEEDCAILPRYLEFVSQIPITNPTGEHLWKAAAVWVKLERTAGQYREFVDDICTGQMARKYLSVSDRVQTSAENRVRPSLNAAGRSLADISSGYAQETAVSRLEQHLEALGKCSDTLGWIGADYFEEQHDICMKKAEARGGATRTTSANEEIFSKTFDERMSEIKMLTVDVGKHMGVCKVYSNCMEKFARLLENGLQARDVKPIKQLKKQLADKEPDAPNEDSAKVLTYGRDEMDRRVEAEAERMRRARDQLESLCRQPPDFARASEYLGQLRESQNEVLEIKSVFYALNLFEDAEKADAVKRLAERRVRAFDKLREMHDAQQEMQTYARELQQMPGPGMRTGAQHKRADAMRKSLRNYRIKFSPWKSNPDLEEYTRQCLDMVDELMAQVGE
jgi:hypothetical protein